MRLCIPVLCFVKSISKPVFAPYFIAEICIIMPERFHRFFGCIRKGRKSCRRCYGTMIIGGRVRVITIIGIAGGKSPAVFTISLKRFWIIYAVTIIDQRVVLILLPIVGIAVF